MASARQVLVIGSGPAGLASAAGLRARGQNLHLVDRDACIGGAYARMWPELMLSSPASLIPLPGLALGPSAPYIPAGEYRSYLERYARTYELAPERCEVRCIEPLARGYRVRLARPESHPGGEAEAEHSFDAVIVATGMFDHPVWPDIAGLERHASCAGHARPATSPTGAPRIVHAAAWRGADGLSGRTVLIIGGAISAVEIAEACARARARVLVSARRGTVRLMPRALLGHDLTGLALPWIARLPRALTRSPCEHGFTARALDLGFRRLRAQGAIEVRHELLRLHGRRAEFARGPAVEVDAIIVATGYRHAMPFAPRDLARTAAGHPRTRDCQSVSHPGLFFVGTPCARSLASQYLYGLGRDAWHVADILARR